jgi:hypothetical protein
MEQAGEMGDIGREALHEGVLQSGSDTGEHKDKIVDCEKDEQFQPKWRKFLAHVGPGALVAIGFLDPSNLETDMQAGADFKYELLWVVLVGMIFCTFDPNTSCQPWSEDREASC